VRIIAGDNTAAACPAATSRDIMDRELHELMLSGLQPALRNQFITSEWFDDGCETVMIGTDASS
jgi:hypothetical protein